MKRNLLFLLMAILLPGLASADNMAIQKNRASSYGSSGRTENRLAIPCEAAGFSSPMSGSENYTIAAWLKPSNIIGTDKAVVMALSPQFHLNNNGNWVVMCDTSGNLFLAGHGGASDHGLASAGVAVGTSTNAKIAVGEWNYVSVVIDNANLKFSIYVNGAPAYSTDLTEAVYFPANLQNGGDGPAWFNVGGYGMDAVIDEVHAFNTALSADDVAKAYTSPSGIASLTGYYTFDALGETDGYFPNEAANAADNSEAVFNKWSTSDYQWGWVNGTNAPTAATLVEGRELAPSTFSFTCPGVNEFENLATLTFTKASGGMIYEGETLSGLEAGDKIYCMFKTADGYTATSFMVGDESFDLVNPGGGNQYVVTIVVSGDITPDMIKIGTKHLGYALTITQPENAVITVMNGDAEVATGDLIAAGTELTLSAEVEAGYSLSQFTLNGQPIEGNTFTMPEEAATISADVAAVDYCEATGTTPNPNKRGISQITVNGTAISGPGTSSNRVIFADHTDTEIVVKPGETVSLTANGSHSWMMGFIYVDYDNNGWNVDPEQIGLNGDLVWYEQMIPVSQLKISDATTYDMEGNAITGDARNCEISATKDLEASFVIPENLAAGTYRARFKIDWASNEPCGSSVQGQSLSANAGTMIDFTFRVEAAEQKPTVVDTKIYNGTLTVDLEGSKTRTDGVDVKFLTMSDDTYTLLLENFGAEENNPDGMGSIEVTGIVREGDNLTGHADNISLMGGMIQASADLTGVIEGEDITLNLDVLWEDEDIHIPVVFTTKPVKAELSFRRKYTDGTKRYYNEIGYNVLGSDKIAYQTADPTAEDYFVTPVQGSWQEEGAFIDLSDKLVEIPVNAEEFTMILKGISGTNWSQSCVYIDWNNNGSFIDEGETNGVINLGVKPNQPGGGMVTTETGDRDLITLPEGLNEGDTFSMLICLNEPKGINGTTDMWGDNWEWSKEIFTDDLCSLINGEAYALTLKITAADYSAIDGIGVDQNNAPVEYYNLQGIRVNADQLVPGIYVVRQGNRTAKVLVK